MTGRAVFNIILKILGLLFIDDVLALLIQLLSAFIYFKESNIDEGIWTFMTTLLLLFAYTLVSYLLIFKSNYVIDKLKLDQGFVQETITVNVHHSIVLTIVIIVLGGLIIVDELPNFGRRLFLYYQERRMTYGQTKPDISYSMMAAGKILVGLLLILNHRRIVTYIEFQRRKKRV